MSFSNYPFLVLDSTDELPKNLGIPKQLTVHRLNDDLSSYRISGYAVHSTYGEKRWFAYRHMPYGRQYMGAFKGYYGRIDALQFVMDLSL